MLDEATSSIDSESEMLIQNSIEKLTKGRTYRNRSSLINYSNATQIILLEKGQLVEQGTHKVDRT